MLKVCRQQNSNTQIRPKLWKRRNITKDVTDGARMVQKNSDKRNQ